MNWRAFAAVALATAGFACALALRERVDPWLTTAAVGVACAGLAAWALGPRLHLLLTTTAPSAALAIGLGVLLVVATHLAYRGLATVAPALAHEVRMLYGSISAPYGRVALAGLTLVVVLAEELVWRGAALELVRDEPRRKAAAVSVLLYTLPQVLAGAWLLVAAAAALGTLFAAQRLMTGRLTDSFLTHGVWSVCIFVVYPLA